MYSIRKLQQEKAKECVNVCQVSLTGSCNGKPSGRMCVRRISHSRIQVHNCEPTRPERKF